LVVICKLRLVAVQAAMLLALAACEGPYGREVPNVPAELTRMLGVSNSERAWCADQGADLERRRDLGGNLIGVCVFPNGQECEAQRVARGLCGPGVVGPRFGRGSR
jgi:putative hemolysin